MADRKPVRRPVLDPAVADLLAGMEEKQAESRLPRKERERKARERAKIQARRDQRVTYDIPPSVRQYIKDLADDLSLPASQLASLALMRFISDYEKGAVELSSLKRPSRSPRYDWNLSLPDALLPKTRKK